MKNVFYSLFLPQRVLLVHSLSYHIMNYYFHNPQKGQLLFILLDIHPIHTPPELTREEAGSGEPDRR